MKTAISLALAIAAVVLAPGAQAGQAPAPSGEAIYARCLGCHALAYDRTGPRHCGLFGRRAGSVPGFAYSEAMRRAGIVWDAKTLNRFLADPGRTVAGTSMTYAGVKDPAERKALIDYLRRAASGPECRG